MPQEIARDADTTWLERRNRRRGAMPKQVRRYGLSKRGARAVRYHPSDRVCSQRAPCPTGPERAMLVGTWKHRAHLSEINVQIRHEWLRYGDFEVPSRLRLRAVEDHAPFFSNSPQVYADTNQRKSPEAQRSACKQSNHQPVPIDDGIFYVPARPRRLLHQLYSQRDQPRSGDDPVGLRARLAFAPEPRNDAGEVLRHPAWEHDPDGFAQFLQIHMLAERSCGFSKMLHISGKPLFGEPFDGTFG